MLMHAIALYYFFVLTCCQSYKTLNVKNQPEFAYFSGCLVADAFQQ